MHIKNSSLVDITPYELYETIDKSFNEMKMHYVKPTKLFKLMYWFYLSPKDLLIVRRFNKNALNYLVKSIQMQYQKVDSESW